MGAMFTNAQHTIVFSPPPIVCTESRHQLLAEIEDLKQPMQQITSKIEQPSPQFAKTVDEVKKQVEQLPKKML